VIKTITITILLVISLTSCVINTQNSEVIILNNTDSIIEADLYNTWSGETESKWKLQKGINKFSLNRNSLYGLYAKGYPEKTIYNHSNTSITFEKDELILDEINQEVNAHHIWSQQIITGESQSIFHWKKNNLNCLSDWKTFDSLLFKSIEDSTFTVKKGALNSKNLTSYPAAYILIDKVLDNKFVSISKKMNHIHKKLTFSGIQSTTKNKFLRQYLTPQSLSLRNDSIIHYADKYFPEVAKIIKAKYQKLKASAKLKSGMNFPDFIHKGDLIKSTELVKNYEYTIIDFWATWCIPCIKQMPEMNDFAIQYKDNIQFVSLSVDNERDYEKWLNIASKYNAINHYWLSDTTTVRDDMGIKGLPRMILLDKEGKIIDPNFPHLYDPLAKLWINSLANMPLKKVAEKH
jgi:thiol-disulfide isomerase/thioredoxin